MIGCRPAGEGGADVGAQAAMAAILPPVALKTPFDPWSSQLLRWGCHAHLAGEKTEAKRDCWRRQQVRREILENNHDSVPISQQKKLSSQKFLCACPSLHICYKKTKFSTNSPSLAWCILLHLPLQVVPALRGFQAGSGNGSLPGCPRTGCCTWGLGQGLETTEEGAVPFHYVAFFIYLPLLVWPLQKILIWIHWQLAGNDDDDKNNYVRP